MASNRRRSTLGNIWQHRGRWAAKYSRDGQTHTPGRTFTTFKLADDWLGDEQRLIDRDEWTPPGQRRAAAEAEEVRTSITLDEYARDWVENRTTSSGRPLAPKTVHEYSSYLDGRLSQLAALPIVSIDRARVETWWQDNADKPPARHVAYALVKSVLKSAVSHGLISENPCQIPNAARRARVTPKQVRSELVTGLQPPDIDALVAALDRENFRLMLLLVAYCGLRPGEAFALTRKDIRRGWDADGTPRYLAAVHRAVSLAPGGRGRAVGPTKTQDSIRTIPLPPHLALVADAHLDRWAEPGDDGLLFPSTNPTVAYATERQVMGTYAGRATGETGRGGRERDATGFVAARLAIGRPALRIYDLRHWARRIWTLSGLDFASVEMLLGHGLTAVQGTYAHLDPEHIWPYADRVSERAGWTRPTTSTSTATTSGLPGSLSPRLLAAMTAEQVGAVLAGLPDDQLAAVVSMLPAGMLATLLTAPK